MQAITYRGKILELEGLRGLAILLVTLHHFWPSSGSFYERFFAVGHLGWIGVDLFFVISGLLIGGILLDTREDPGYFRNFYARRVVRIFPLYYLLVLTVYALVPTVQAYLHKVSYLQSEFIAQSGHPLWYLLFSGNIREAIRGVEPAYMLAPLWSISIEEQFYFCAPLLIMSLPRRRLSFLLGAFMLLAPLFRYLMWQSFPDNERIQYLATLSRLDNLSIGLLMAIMLRSEVRWKFKWLWPLLLALTAAFVVMFVSGLFNRFTFFCRVFGYSFLAIYFAVMVLWAIVNQGQRVTALLRHGALMRLGSLCYGMYLLQRPTEVVLVKVLAVAGFDLDAWPTTSLVCKFIAAWGVAALSWRFFEEPINRLKVRFKSAHHPLA